MRRGFHFGPSGNKTRFSGHVESMGVFVRERAGTQGSLDSFAY